MSTLYLSYIELSPELENRLTEVTHYVILDRLRKHFPRWQPFHSRFKTYDLGFILVTDNGIKELHVKGPTISPTLKIVDFSIFLPESVDSLQPGQSESVRLYLDLVFSGISRSVTRYGILPSEIETIKDECLLELGTINTVQ